MGLTPEEGEYLKEVLDIHILGLREARERQIEDGSLDMDELLDVDDSILKQTQMAKDIKEKIDG
jgi:hypothetical protein